MKNHIEIEGIDASTYAGKAAAAVKVKARGILGDDLLNFNLINFVSFMLIHDKFMSKGIVITDDTKEECYIKIIELGDEKLIDDLEKYINLKDNITRIEKQKEEYDSVIAKLQNLSNKNDEIAVNSAVEEYLRK